MVPQGIVPLSAKDELLFSFYRMELTVKHRAYLVWDLTGLPAIWTTGPPFNLDQMWIARLGDLSALWWSARY
jgi:hypothetical protein